MVLQTKSSNPLGDQLTQLVACYLVGLHLAQARGVKFADEVTAVLDQLKAMPGAVDQVLETMESVRQLARELASSLSVLFIGRHVGYPVALEGALKLKEISYVHAEGYPAGEMKHGPIALIEDRLPVVALCPRGRVYEKMLSNVQEVKARGGRVLAIVVQGDTDVRAIVEQPQDIIIDVPPIEEVWSPLLTVIPLQLLAYHTAVRAGRDVDQPRNLAKSVTVE